MKKHAISHGLAALACTVSSGVLIQLGNQHFPTVARAIEDLSRLLINTFGLDFTPAMLSVLIVTTLLATVWGTGFYFLHSD